MKHVFSIIIVFSLAFTTAKSQSKIQRQQHDSLSRIAKQYFDENNFEKAASAYSKSFIALGNKGFPDDRFRAAIAWSHCGNNDSAFVQLFKLASKTEYLDFQKVNTSADFNYLHSDSRWNELVKILNPNNETYNDSLANVLSEIRITDQKYRSMIKITGDKYGWESKELKELKSNMNYYDSLNLITITTILDSYGWPGKVEVGNDGSTTVWLVIQHADLPTQEKYFPILKRAVEEKKASEKDLAYLEDRILMRQGKKQIYGTQYQMDKDGKQKLWEVEDPDHLNERRKSVGL